MDVRFCLSLFLVILVIGANANVIKDPGEYEGVTSRLVRLKFILDFSSWSFGIRVNHLVLSWCIITSSLFFYLTK